MLIVPLEISSLNKIVLAKRPSVATRNLYFTLLLLPDQVNSTFDPMGTTAAYDGNISIGENNWIGATTSSTTKLIRSLHVGS